MRRTELRERDLGELIGACLSVAADRFGPLLLVGFACYLPMLLVQGLLMPDIPTFGATPPSFEMIAQVYVAAGAGLLIYAVLYPLELGLATWIVAPAFTGRALPWREVVRRTVRRYPALLMLSVAVGTLEGVGYLFCLVPGVVLATWFYVASVALLLEDRGWLDALQRSRELTEGHRVWIFVVWIVVRMLLPMTGAPAALFAQVIPSTLGQTLIGGLVQVVFVTFALAAPVVVYYHLRVVKESLDLKILARLVDQIGAEAAAQGAAPGAGERAPGPAWGPAGGAPPREEPGAGAPPAAAP